MLTNLFRSFRQLWLARKRKPIRKHQPKIATCRLGLELLEDRVLPSGNTEIFGGLEFMTTGNGAFAAGTNLVSATTAVEVGVNPGAGTFHPFLQLDDGVQFNPKDTTGSFTTDGTVSAIVDGIAVPLLNTGSYKFTGPGLLSSSSYFALPAGDGAAFSVAGADLAVSALHLSGQELDLQGSLTLPILSGLSLAVNGANHVAVTATGVGLTGLDVTVPGPTPITVEGLSITTNNLQVEYSAANNAFEASGSASVSVAGNTLSLTLGSSSNPGLIIENGVLQSLNASVNLTTGSSDTPFKVAGVSFGLTSATFTYDATSNTFGIGAHAAFEADGQMVDVTLGSAGTPGLVIQNGALISLIGSVTSNIQIGGLMLMTKDLTVNWSAGGDVTITGEASLMYDNQSIDLSLGSTDASGNQAGIDFNPSTGQLDALNATVNSDIEIAGITLKAEDLSIQYAAADATLTISGSASFEMDDDGGDMPIQSVEVSLGTSGTDGLVINTMSGAFSFDASITSDISIAGLEIQANDLAVAYQSTSGNFVISGSASVAWAGNNIQLTLGGASSQGLVINNGQLASLEASVTSNLSFLGITLEVNDFTVVYVAANSSTNTPEELAFFGSVSLQSSFVNFTTTLGTEADPGIEIANGVLENLNITLNGGFSVDDIGFSANGVAIQYNSSMNELDLSGGVTLELTRAFQISASIGGGGLMIDPSTGDLSIGPQGVSIMGSGTFGPFSIAANIAFSNGSSGINLSVSGDVDLPGGIDVGIKKFDIVNGQLADIGLTYSAVAPSLGIPIADTGFYVTALSGELDNLNNPSQIVVSASATVDFGAAIDLPSIPGIFAGGQASIVQAMGSITVSATQLDLTGNVTILGGLLGQGSASVDLNWSTGIYQVSGQFGLLDNIVTFGGSLTITNQGDIYAEAMASVNIPAQVPFIGGQSLANVDFALDYLPNEPSNQSFVAVWTNVLSFTIGFKIDFAGDFNLLDGSDVQQIQTSISATQTVSDYTYFAPFTITGANVAGANVTIGSPSFQDYDYADNGAPVSDTVSDTEGNHLFVLSHSDPILATMTITVYQEQQYGTDQELGTISFDQDGNWTYTPLPGFAAYAITDVSVDDGHVQLIFSEDPGPTMITATYLPANGAYLELLQETAPNQYSPVFPYSIDPTNTPNGAGGGSAYPDGETYTDVLTSSASPPVGGSYGYNFTLSQGSPNVPTMSVNVYSGGSTSGTFLGQITFPDGGYHFTPGPNTPYVPVGAVVQSNVLTLDFGQNAGPITVSAMYCSLTDRVIHINLATDAVAGGMPGMYEIELVQPQALNDADLSYSESLEYQTPTVSFQATSFVDENSELHYALDASAFTPQSQQADDTSTTVSIYYNTTDSILGGTLIDTLDYSAMTGQGTSRTANFTWAGFQDLKAGKYYFYAVINDGQSVPQYSAITGPVTSAGPVPVLTAPSDVILTPTANHGETGVFGAAAGTALTVATNTQNPVTVTLSVTGGTLTPPGGTPAAAITQTYPDGSTPVLDGLTFNSDEAFSGAATLTYTASQDLVEVTDGGMGYQSTPTVTFASQDGLGSGATGIVTAMANGQVEDVEITNPGSGYDEPPAITFSGGDPTMPAAAKFFTYTATQSIPLVAANTHLLVTQTVSGSASGVSVASGGSGYQSAPTVIFTSSDGNGSGAAGFATINGNGQVVSVTITNPGLGYDAPPMIRFSGGNPTTSASATAAIITPPANQDSAYLTITVTNPGGLDDQNGTNVQVQDFLSPGLTVLAASPSQGSFDPNTGIWTVGNLPITGVNTASLTLTVQASTDTYDTQLTSAVQASSALPAYPAMDAQSTVQILPVSHNIAVTPSLLPTAALNYFYQVNLAADRGGGGPYTFSLASGSLPAGMFVAASGLIYGAPTASGTFNFSVTATNQFGVSAAVPLQLNVANVPLALVGTPFSLAVPYVEGGIWSVSSGSLPPGLSLQVVNFYAFVTGTPTTPGTYTFDIQEYRSGGQLTTTDSYTVVVDSLIIASQDQLPPVTIGSPYTADFMAMGGTGVYFVGLADGPLPAGLSFDGTSGVLSGTVADGATPGSYPITVFFQDQQGQVTTQNYTLQVNASLILAPTTLNAATVGSPYSEALIASGGSGTGYMFGLASGSLPTGLTLSASGIISGAIPPGSVAAPASFVVNLTDSSGSSINQPYTLTVNPPLLIGPNALPAAGAGQAYSQALTATGGSGGYTFVLQSGQLASGLTLSPAGILSGSVDPNTPSGYDNFTVNVADANGDAVTQAYSLFIDADLTLGPAALPDVKINVPYSEQLTATGGSGIYSFAFVGGRLPAGLTLSPAGRISGTVLSTTLAETYDFTVAVTDSLGISTVCNCSLTVVPIVESWTGAASAAWSNPLNWSAHVVPGAGVNATIPTRPTGRVFPVLDVAATTDNLAIQAGATLTLDGHNLTVDGTFTNPGTLVLDATEGVELAYGNDSAEGTWKFVGDGTGQTMTIAKYDVDKFFNLTIADAHSRPDVFQTTYSLTINGALTVSGGTLNGLGGSITTAGFSLSGTGVFDAPALFNDSGAWTVTGGTFNPEDGLVNFTGASMQTIATAARPFFNVSHTGAGTLSISGAALVVNGALTNAAGIIKSNNLSVTVAGAATLTGGNLVAGTFPVTFKDGLTLNGGNFQGGAGSVTAAGVDILAGVLNAPSSIFYDSGNWALAGGAFNAGTGTVDLIGANQVVSGSTNFHNLTKSVTAPDTLTFQAGSTQTVGGTLTLKGATGKPLNLRSSISGSAWNIDPLSACAVAFTDVQDSHDVSKLAITAAHSHDSGDDSGWLFPTTSQSWTGAGSTNFSDPRNWSLGFVPNTGDNLTIAATARQPVLTAPLTVHNLTIAAGASLNLNGQALTVTGSFVNPGTLILQGTEAISLAKGNDTTEGTWEYVGDNTGDIVSLAGSYFNLTISDTHANADTYQAASALVVKGKFTIAGGTFNANGNTTTVTGQTTLTAGAYLAGLAAQSFGGLVVSGGAFTGGAGPVTTTNLTVSGGAFTAPAQLNVSGNWIFSGGTFNANMGTVSLVGANQTITGSTTFFNLTKTASSAETLTFQASSAQTIQGTLTLEGAAGKLLALRSSKTGSAWRIDPLGVSSLTLVDLEDCLNESAAAINAVNSRNSGDNVNIDFTA